MCYPSKYWSIPSTPEGLLTGCNWHAAAKSSPSTVKDTSGGENSGERRHGDTFRKQRAEEADFPNVEVLRVLLRLGLMTACLGCPTIIHNSDAYKGGTGMNNILPDQL